MTRRMLTAIVIVIAVNGTFTLGAGSTLLAASGTRPFTWRPAPQIRCAAWNDTLRFDQLAARLAG
jgi:hypothetical protein